MPAQISAGDLTTPIAIERRIPIATSSGGSDDSWETVVSLIFARDAHNPSSAVLTGGELVTAVSHVYTVRYHSLIVKGLYVHDPEIPNRMLIQAVIPDVRRATLTLYCTDVES